jgi:trehalose 6-phosphate synthase
MSTELNAVMVSDRGPLSFTDRDGELEAQARPGSVTEIIATACRCSSGKFMWFATSSDLTDARAIAEQRFAEMYSSLGFSYEPLLIDECQYREYYDEASVRLLYFTHHDLWDELNTTVSKSALAAFDNAFTAVNSKFAKRIIDTIPDAVPVLFHDYQFALCPDFVRKSDPKRPIAHFSHSAFGSPASFRRLPKSIGCRVLVGMLGADLLGFQSPRWARHFLDCCAAFLPAEVDYHRGTVHYKGRTTWLRIYPVAINSVALRSIAVSPAARFWADRLPADPARPRIARVDRLDPSKNILRSFAAFEALLADWPQSMAMPVFNAYLVPSRPNIPEYSRYAAQVKAYQEKLSAKYPSTVQVFVGQNRERAFAALRNYDVLCVNSLADGMNLVAFEGAALNERAGVLVLSDRAGCTDYLGTHAVRITDPYDLAETTQALRTAIGMPLTQRAHQAAALRRLATERDAASWLAEQLTDLDRISYGENPATSWL